MQLHDLRQNFFMKQFLVPVVALMPQPFANLFLQFVKCRRIAHVFCEIIIQLGQFFRFDSQHLDRVVIFLAREFGVRIIRRIFHVKILVVASIRALQVGVERLHRFFRSDVAQHAVRLQRIAAAFRRAQQLHLSKVTVLNRPPFYGRKRCGTLTHLFQGFRYVVFRDIHRGHLEFQPFVIAQLKFRQHLKHGAKLQRLAFVEIQLVHFWLRNRRELLLRHRFLHAFGHQRLQHFALDVLRESPPNQRNWRFAPPESRNGRDAREFLRDTFDLLRHFLRGDFQLQLAAAGCFSHATVLSRGDWFGKESFAGLDGTRLVGVHEEFDSP